MIVCKAVEGTRLSDLDQVVDDTNSFVEENHPRPVVPWWFLSELNPFIQTQTSNQRNQNEKPLRPLFIE